MKENKAGGCPGCGKHCPANAPRCKYGRAYFEKLERETGAKEGMAAHCRGEERKKRFKWERYVTRDDVLHQLLLVSRRTKKALCEGERSEEKLLLALKPEERQALSGILRKLEQCL